MVKFNLTKVTSRIFDERLPFRGFLNGEIENISKLKLWDHKTGKSQWVEVDELEKIHEMRYIIEYITKNASRVIPEVASSVVENDIDLFNNVRHDFLNNPYDIEVEGQFPSQLISEGRKLVINGEIEKDRHGRFRYSAVKFWSEHPGHYQKEAIRSINLLISKYRIYTGSYWITNVTEQEFFIYKSISGFSSSSLLSKGLTQTKDDYDEDVVNKIQESLLNKELDIPYFYLRLDALNAIEEANYHLAVIYSITALESLVKFYISSIFTDKKLKNRLMKIGLHQLVTVILRLIINSVDYDRLLAGITKSIQLRNMVIHEAQLNISKERAEKVIKVVEEYCIFILSRLDTNY